MEQQRVLFASRDSAGSDQNHENEEEIDLEN